jgi:hypothetical protein
MQPNAGSSSLGGNVLIKAASERLFYSLYAIMFLDASGTLDEPTAAVDAKITAFKVIFEGEPAVMEYFVRH